MSRYFQRLLALTALSFDMATGHSQNLVPNASFEEYALCTDSTLPGLVTDAVGWLSYGRTPDYFNSCRGASCAFCVPDNTVAWQQPANGQAYAGVCCYFDQELYREMIGVQLLEPLIPGQVYYGSFKVNSAAEKPEQSTDVFGTNKIGLLFTNQGDGFPDGDGEYFDLRNYAQIYSQEILNDTASWVVISGSFVADSAYQYMVIGNHFDDEHTDTLQLVPGASGLSYYFIDEVCVSQNPFGCPMANSIDGMALGTIGIWPNPASSDLVVYFSREASAVRLMDATGRLMYESGVVGLDRLAVDLSTWSNGLYIAVVVNGPVTRSMRFMLVH